MFPLTPYTSTMGLSGLKLNLAVAFIATCAFWLFGYDMSVMVSTPARSRFKGSLWLPGWRCYRGAFYLCISGDEQT
jgi:hypothetical protein